MVSRVPLSRVAAMLRILGLVALTGVLAPATFSLLLGTCVAILHPSKAAGAPEMLGLTLWAVMLGVIPTISCCLPALCCVWLAKRFGVASLAAFTTGGAVLALMSWGAITIGDIADFSFRALIDSAELLASLAATGALCGSLWWAVVGRSGRDGGIEAAAGL